MKRSSLLLPKSATYAKTHSPIGELTIITSSQGLHAILWEKDSNPSFLSTLKYSGTETLIVETKKQLSEYFQAARQEFDLPIVLQGTDFQVKAWQELLKIPYAQTISYGEQAQNLGDKKKARAVGMVNGQNPISIVVPCHRVIGSKGQLVGFGGGIENKAYLLKLERTIESH